MSVMVLMTHTQRSQNEKKNESAQELHCVAFCQLKYAQTKQNLIFSHQSCRLFVEIVEICDFCVSNFCRNSLFLSIVIPKSANKI